MDVSQLELLASRAVYASHAFERAIHDHGPWTMTWGPHTVPAVRTIHEGGVSFAATFPEVCYIERPSKNVTLNCRGEVAAIRDIAFPGDAAFAISWALTATEPDLTSV